MDALLRSRSKHAAVFMSRHEKHRVPELGPKPDSDGRSGFWREAAGRLDARLECNRRDLQYARNVLILLGRKTVVFTPKPMKSHRKHETLNHRVPGSSPGAPTKLFKHLAV